MKKILIVLSIIIIILVSKQEDTIIIPESSLRFRVIANSNTLDDQVAKNNLSKDLSSYITSIIKNAKSKEEATNLINQNYENINNHIDNYLTNNKMNHKYNLNIGRNYFPQKKYKGVTYNAGYYDSIVLTLGNGNGINWWCVMYPPLCLIDEDEEEIEYTTIVKEIINKY